MHNICHLDGELKDSNGTPKLFGGKIMVFLGDYAQLRPVYGVAIHNSGTGCKDERKSY